MTMPNAKEPELIPCPFCGGQTKLGIRYAPKIVLNNNGTYGVTCSSCGAEGPASDTKNEAADDWNRRAK